MLLVATLFFCSCVCVFRGIIALSVLRAFVSSDRATDRLLFFLQLLHNALTKRVLKLATFQAGEAVGRPAPGDGQAALEV